jgi:hypothetical protein
MLIRLSSCCRRHGLLGGVAGSNGEIAKKVEKGTRNRNVGQRMISSNDNTDASRRYFVLFVLVGIATVPAVFALVGFALPLESGAAGREANHGDPKRERGKTDAGP